MNKRPILVATIGYILGILWGLYFNFSIVLLHFHIVAIYAIIKRFLNKKRRFKLISVKRYIRYLKLFLNKKTIISIIIISTISNTIILNQNHKYQNLYQEENINIIGIIESNKTEKQYKNTYILKVKSIDKSTKYKDTKIYLSTNKNRKLEYGDMVKIEGIFKKPEVQRNENGFDYSKYLRTLKIYGTIEADNVEIIKKNQVNSVFIFSNNISLKIKQKIFEIFSQKEASIISGILLGDTSQINEEIEQDFRISNFTHILAVSGMHVEYIVVFINIIFIKMIGKRNTKILTIIILIIYMFITGFSPSIVRAGTMGILVSLAWLIHRKNDLATSISLSLLILLIYNPYLLTSIGVQLSYTATIGIILFQKNVINILNKIKSKKKNRVKDYITEKIKEILAVIISAQLAILPITLFHFNVLGVYFIITNILVSFIIGPILALGIITLIFSFINLPIAKLISYLESIGIETLIFISKFSNLPISKIYIPTPKIWQIILFYISVISLNIFLKLKNQRKLNQTQRRVINLYHLLKFKCRINQKKIIVTIILISILFCLIQFIPKNFEINFIDVGQGDCTFIVTPQNKTILIDGGGSKSESFDVGEKTLLPFILDKGYTKIDYIIISHFDQDHVRSVF